MEKKVEKKKFDLSGFGKAICFLLLEILAVISFSLGSSFIFFGILSMVIFLLILLVTFRQIKTDGLASIGFFLFPLLIFGLLTVLSYFKYDTNFALNNSPFSFLIPVGLICFAASGYFINLTGVFKIHHALVVIYSAIALLVFINLLVTMIQFVPFYTLIYDNYYFYYNGAPSSSSIGKMGYFLMNFSMVEVSLSYFQFYPMILLTAFLPLSHIGFKENRRLFILYLCFGVLGLLTIILTINKMALLMLFGVAVIIGLISLYDRFHFKTKPLKIATAVFAGLMAVGIFVLFLNAQDSVGYQMRIAGLRNLTTGNSLFNKIFNTNYFVRGYNSILDGTFSSSVIDGQKIMLKLFGYPVTGDYVYNFGAMTWTLTDSNSMFFDTFFTSGFFGVVFYTLFIIMGLRAVIKYYANSKDDPKDKVMILGFVLVSLAYAFINFDCTPMIFSKRIIPFFMNNIFMIDIFFFGYCYFNSKKQEEPKKEVVESEKEQQA